MAASHTGGPDPRFPVGTVLSIYAGEHRRMAPGGSAVTTATVASDRTWTATGLGFSTRYTAAATVNDRWLTTLFSTESDPDLEPIEGTEAADIRVKYDTTRTHTFYAATDGDDDNSGSSAVSPKTFQGALDIMESWGAQLVGTWEIICAAGTYDETPYSLADNVLSQGRLTIRGPDVSGHPNVPTMILDAAGAGHGLILGAGTNVHAKDMKGINASTSDSSTAAAFLANTGADVWWQNIHYAGNGAYAGIYNNACRRARVSGGVASGTQQYGRVYYNVDPFTDGYGHSSVAEGPDVTAGTVTLAGTLAQGGYGDVFYIDTDGVPIAVLATANGRARVANSEITNCTTAGIKGQEGGRVGGGPVDNTMSGNAADVILVGGATMLELHENAVVPWRHHYDTASASLTGSTTRTAIKSGILSGILADADLFRYAIGRTITVRAFGTFTGTAGSKTLEFALLSSGYGSIVFPSTENGSWQIEADLFITGISAQTGFIRGFASVAPTADHDRVTRTITLDGTQSGRIYGTLGNAADTITVEAVQAFIT